LRYKVGVDHINMTSLPALSAASIRNPYVQFKSATICLLMPLRLPQ